jgi:hypothetical protein
MRSKVMQKLPNALEPQEKNSKNSKPPNAAAPAANDTNATNVNAPPTPLAPVAIVTETQTANLLVAIEIAPAPNQTPQTMNWTVNETEVIK